MSAPTVDNISVKEYNEISKYKDWEIQSKKMWCPKNTALPVIVGALGMMKQGTDKHINKISGSPSQNEIQKIALCRTSHLLKSVLWMELVVGSWLNVFYGISTLVGHLMPYPVHTHTHTHIYI